MRTGRKILAILLAVVMILSFAACGESGGTTVSGEPTGGKTSTEPSTSTTAEDDGGFLGLGNLFSGEPEEKISWDLTDGVLTISGKGEMDDYSPMRSLYPEWYDNREEITEILIEDGITRIGDYAFYNLKSATTVTIPASMTRMGDYAFQYCSSLATISGGENVIDVGAHPFMYTAWENAQTDDFVILNGWLLGFNGKVSTLEIPDGVTIIGDMALRKSDKFTTVTIPDSVTRIGNEAFASCKWLKSVTIPDSVTSIGEDAFSWCDYLSEVSGGKNVFEVGSDPFGGTPWLDAQTDTFVMLGSCLIDYNGSSSDITIPNGTTSIGTSFPDNVRSIKIPASVTSLDGTSLCLIDSLSVIAVDGENPAYCVVDGVLFNKEKTELICYPGGKSGSSYEIPDSVTSIGEYAFAGCSSLTSITIPDSVSTIGGFAFRGCEALTTAAIPDGITHIGSYMFADCISLSSVTIPDSVTGISNDAFNNCVSLTDVYYGGSSEDWEEIVISSQGNDALFSCTIH